MMTEATPSPELAIYIHVPFCGQRCAYCHFEIKVFHPKTRRAPFYREYLACVIQELKNHAPEFSHRTVGSVFFGGGTPSRLRPDQVGSILEAVREWFRLEPGAEISFETNPEDADPDYLLALRELGVTRVSLGVQSFHDPCLRAIGRPHDRETALNAIKRAPTFPHGLSFDLIVGLPFQTEQILAADLATVAELKPEHVSLYMLDQDLPTPLDKTGRFLEMPNEDEHAAFYETARAFLKNEGYRHYEISNFARPGFECRHNLVYWRRGDYLGIGPAAHGQIGNRYAANHPRLADYLTAVRAHGSGTSRRETWRAQRMRQERIIQGLRLEEGVPASWLRAKERAELFSDPKHGLVEQKEDRVRLTEKGQLFANEIFQVFV